MAVHKGEAPKHNVIVGDSIIKALGEAGIVDDWRNVRRIIIDAEQHSAVFVYVERFGDERLLGPNLIAELAGAEVVDSGDHA